MGEQRKRFGNLMVPRAVIEGAKTPNGGWTRDQLAQWGVGWPPPHGWRRALERGEPLPVQVSP